VKVSLLDKYVIRGGKPLYGEVEISGAKNAAVAIIPASLMVNGVCRIENIPAISDTDMLLTILTHLGAKVRMINRNTVEIDCTAVRRTGTPFDLMRKIRASYYLIGSMLGRFGSAKTTMPGGCNFGVRPIDQHIKGMTALGAEVNVSGGFIYADAKGGRLKGARIYLDKVSVGATINIIIAATLAEGQTIIENAAREPHIVDLANFLNSMGADIRGAGTDTVKVNGVDRLHGGTYSLIPDQIEAGTYMAAVAATGGSILIKNTLTVSPQSCWKWASKWRSGTIPFWSAGAGSSGAPILRRCRTPVSPRTCSRRFPPSSVWRRGPAWSPRESGTTGTNT
jgi:UDP-N-acetylglucosamine 1-carboxyvinyltransferase